MSEQVDRKKEKKEKKVEVSPASTPTPRLTRRSFLRSAGAIVAAATTGTAVTSCDSSVESVQSMLSPGQPALPSDPTIITTAPTAVGGPETEFYICRSGDGQPRALEFFRPHEARTVEAITARILPGTPDDPGAREAGVTNYIDCVLSSGLGFGEPTFREPPFAMGYAEDAPPTQEELDSNFSGIWLPNEQLERYGYQSVLTPREAYRIGLTALDRYANNRFGSNFVDLGEGDQDLVVEALATGEADGFDDPSADAFFETLREHTIEGMFSDPIYGGNHELAGWRLVGYPGAQRGYTPQEMMSEGIQREPQSLINLHHYHPGQTDERNVLLPVQGSDR